MFRVFRRLIRLPLQDIDALKCVMHCLYKESMLFNGDEASSLLAMQEALQQSLEERMLRDIVVDREGMVIRVIPSNDNNKGASSRDPPDEFSKGWF
jgi:hypothetical protein